MLTGAVNDVLVVVDVVLDQDSRSVTNDDLMVLHFTSPVAWVGKEATDNAAKRDKNRA